MNSGTRKCATCIDTYLGRYLIVISKSEKVGNLNGHDIYRVAETDVYPLKHYNSVNSDEEKYLSLLKGHLKASTLYYSRTLDLTNSFQRQASNASIDERFFWNSFVSQDFTEAARYDAEVNKFITPLIYGYAKVVETSINGSAVTFGLITRRSRHRAGTRYFRRGIDAKGNVANFNETEQILCVPGLDGSTKLYSYLQTRGSVPMYWAEINNLKYRPTLQISGDPTSSAKKHFDEQIGLYGKNYLVNLVNQKGYELPVKDGYESVVKTLNNPDIEYVYFDFHHECSKMRWYRVQLLIDQLVKLGLDKQRWFQGTVQSGAVIAEGLQTSVVRTNCMDCLDRTNVVQSQLAKWVLQQQLESAHVVEPGYPWDKDEKFTFIFRNMWADNADHVSKAYSGTGALKTDFTRLGHRTKIGALKDAQNSVKRYILNNLADGLRQDGFDLFLGNHIPAESAESPFTDVRPFKYQVIPYVLFGSMFMTITALLFVRNDLPWVVGKLFLVGWIGMFAYSANFMVSNGIQFVNWPKLKELEFIRKVPSKEGPALGWVYDRTISTGSKKFD